MTTIAEAVSALARDRRSDSVAAPDPSSPAGRVPRPTPRRDRQVIEIATLLAAGDRARATGLALEHVVEFPHDADLLTGLTQGSGGQEPPEPSSA
jgi:hypothetical protein